MQRDLVRGGQVFIFLLLLSSFGLAQSELRVIATSRIDTFERELNEHAKQGFRLSQLFEATSIGANSAVLLREAQQTSQQYEYKMLGAMRVATLQKELNAAAEQGYEIREVCAVGEFYVGTDITLVLERPLGKAVQRFQYQLATKPPDHENELVEAIHQLQNQGFQPVKVVRSLDVGLGVFVGAGKSADIVFFAKPITATQWGSTLDWEYQVVATRRLATFEKELNQFAQQGYRIQFSSPGHIALLARKKMQTTALVAYKILKLNKKEFTGEEFAAQAGQGFRYRAGLVGDTGLHAILEKNLQPTNEAVLRPEYKVLKIPFFQKSENRMEQAAQKELAAGFHFLDIVTSNKILLVREQ